MNKKELERAALLDEAKRIFADAVNYDHNTLVGYAQLVKEILHREKEILDNDIVISQLNKTMCRILSHQQYETLKLRYGLNGKKQMTYADSGMSTKLDKLNLSTRTFKCLYYLAGIKTLGELFETSNDELLKIPHFGKTCYEEVLELKNKYKDKVTD